MSQLSLDLGSSNVQLNWKIFEQIIGGIPEAKIATMSQMDLLTHLYEATAMHYSLKFHEEKNMRVKYENKVVEKVLEVAKRDELVQSLTTLSEHNRDKIKAFYDSI